MGGWTYHTMVVALVVAVVFHSSSSSSLGLLVDVHIGGPVFSLRALVVVVFFLELCVCGWVGGSGT